MPPAPDGPAPDGPASDGPASDARPALVVSACLLGTCCNHEGAHSRRDAVEALGGTFRLVPVCPEVAGGLPVPRPAAERRAGRVVTVDGTDVTDAYERGAAFTVELAGAHGATAAVLKARSPSCGAGPVYDGTFTRTLTAGPGVTAAALRAAGVTVWSEEDVAAGAGPVPPGTAAPGPPGRGGATRETGGLPGL